MSNRGEGAKKDEGEERRGESPRVQFEALVAVGEMSGSGGFEAESVDVSQEGMRLRTAYLPNVGDRLVCRFDGATGEVVAEGEVIWRSEEAKGGEFGLRFVGLDDEGREAVKQMVQALAKPEGESDEPAIDRGARVRLHIEGLGSPMKARVRASASKEVEVGSNLEFLRVGRSLELEDVDRGQKREAFVDHVKVDVDPSTNVPQLVVSLRFQAERVEAPATRRAETIPMKKEQMEEAARASASDAPEEDGASGDEAPRAGAMSSAAKMGRAAMGAALPAIAGFGSKAKGAMAGMLAAMQRRRADRAEAKKANLPKRMTAPPPSGALKSEGRRLVREGEDEVMETEPPKKSSKKAALIGSALGLGAVLACYGATRMMSAHHDATPDKTAAAMTAPSDAQQTAAIDPHAPAGPVTANVPLFGPTPLSTIETVPVPAPSALASAAPSAAPNAQPPGDEPSADDNDKPLLKEWGQGTPSHAVTFKIKMDGAIEGVHGSSGANGFTVEVPNHRYVGSATDYAKKDKRLSAVNVVNTSHGCEITVQFRGDVPAYMVKAKGEKLEIALGKETKVAKKSSKKHKKH